MSDLIIAGGDENTEEVKVNYNATEADEEKFFLMYHLHFQPAEVDALDLERRRWIIARFVAQKQMEKEVMENRRIIPAIPTIRQ